MKRRAADDEPRHVAFRDSVEVHRAKAQAPPADDSSDDDSDSSVDDDEQAGRLENAMDERDNRDMADRIRNFTREEYDRYHALRSSHLRKGDVKKLMQQVASGAGPLMAVMMASISKMFVGDLVQEARAFMASLHETGPLRPKHIVEAFRRLQRKHRVPVTLPCLGDRDIDLE